MEIGAAAAATRLRERPCLQQFLLPSKLTHTLAKKESAYKKRERERGEREGEKRRESEAITILMVESSIRRV